MEISINLAYLSQQSSCLHLHVNQSSHSTFNYVSMNRGALKYISLQIFDEWRHFLTIILTIRWEFLEHAENIYPLLIKNFVFLLVVGRQNDEFTFDSSMDVYICTIWMRQCEFKYRTDLSLCRGLFFVPRSWQMNISS